MSSPPVKPLRAPLPNTQPRKQRLPSACPLRSCKDTDTLPLLVPRPSPSCRVRREDGTHERHLRLRAQWLRSEELAMPRAVTKIKGLTEAAAPGRVTEEGGEEGGRQGAAAIIQPFTKKKTRSAEELRVQAPPADGGENSSARGLIKVDVTAGR